ncbi:MAG TPA: arsenical pump-driving ATPase [Gemmatimonadaceae bacterium]
MRTIDVRTPFLFFTGKGGVGKTTVASATALALADEKRRVLIVSTDPASNLDDVFGIEVGTSPTAVPGVATLRVMNIDPEAAAAAYRERMVAPYRGVLPDAAVRNMEEQFSGACTVEIAAFNEFTGLLSDPAIVSQYDHIIFDTAPTGHTLRLLSLPTAWTGFIETNTTGTSCLGPLAGLEAQRDQYAATVDALADAARTTVVLVSRAEGSALREAARAGDELAGLGIRNQMLVVNGVLEGEALTDPVAEAYLARQRAALGAIPAALRELPRVTIPLVPHELTGVAALRAFGDPAAADGVESAGPSAPAPTALALPGLDDLLEQVAAEGHGVVMTMGKGGVGKTTLAAAIARRLAADGHRVHLSTTDPAAHVADAVGSDVPMTLSVSRIDPAAETARYTSEVIADAGALEPDELALLEEDLRSPCTEEIAVFRAFARTVAEAADGFVVLDTAPTGHTLLLLDAAESYHREVARTAGDHIPQAVRELLPRLRDPRFTKMLLVTLPEATPVHEAGRLQADLRRAGIEPFGWVVNASLAASGTAHPALAARARLELPHVGRVVMELATRAWILPWSATANGTTLADSDVAVAASM